MKLVRALAGEVQIYDDAAEVAAAGAAEVVMAARRTLRLRPRFRLALSGGSTPKAMFRLLAGEHARAVDWSRVDFFFGDERCVPPTHADSNYRMAKEALFDGLGAAPDQIFRMRGEGDAESAAREYAATLALAGGVLDLVLLGMGADGHTASLFPGTPALDEGARDVVANVVPPGTTPAVGRITLTYPALSRARRVVVVAVGAEKAPALARVLADDGAPHDPPLRGVRPDAGCLFLVDTAAAG